MLINSILNVIDKEAMLGSNEVYISLDSNYRLELDSIINELRSLNYKCDYQDKISKIEIIIKLN